MQIYYFTDFAIYLKKLTQELAVQAAISKFISDTQTKVVIAVDQRLRYFHVRPILHVLAEVGIDSYAFETQILREDIAKKVETETKTEIDF